MTFTDLLARNAVNIGDRPAIKTLTGTVTWQGLRDRAASLSGQITATGLTAGDRVALYAQCTTAVCVAIHGTAWGGHVVVPLNLRLAGKEVCEQLEDSGAGLIMVDDAHMPKTRDWPEDLQRRVLRISDDGVLDGAAPGPAPRHIGSEDSLTTLLFTGGTTGRSKGVELSSRAMIANAGIVSGFMEMTGNDTCLLSAPMFHISGSGMLWAATLNGASCVPLPTFSPKAVCDSLQALSVNNLFLAPVMIQMVLDQPRFDPGTFKTVRNLLYGASPVTEALLRRVMDLLPQVRLTQAYGQTEICPLTILSHADHMKALDGHPGLLRMAGKVLDGTALKLLNEDGAEQPPGQPGEIYATNPARMNGYFNQPEQTAAVMQDGWIRTGDIGVFDADGYLKLVDRAKDMIVTGGENVYSTEVENALAAHPLVSRAAVIGVPDAKWGERVHAVIEPAGPLTEEELIIFCRESLAGYKCPKTVKFLDALPLTGAGKIDKKPLRARHWAGQERQIG